MLGPQRLGEEVGPIVGCLDEGNRDALLLDVPADEEVSSRDVLSLGVELGVVGDGNARLVIHCQRGREGGLV